MTTQAATSTGKSAEREDRVRTAFYRGEGLTLANPLYLKALRGITAELLRQDAESGDLTVDALGISDRECAMEIRAKEPGVAAGISEAQWIYERAGLRTEVSAKDGEAIATGDFLLSAEGIAAALLSLERTVVNLIQRMSGIATATRRLVASISESSPDAHVVGTRKTLWGLLDKRAISLGGGGTHRLNLGDAILIKTNHLRLASAREANGLEYAIGEAWEHRKSPVFFEVEVTSLEEALIAARRFRDLQGGEESCPCILMFDNFSPEAAGEGVEALRKEGLYEAILVEASGNVTDASLAAYAAAGVDAISIGALTHSCRALDLSAKLIPGAR